MFTKLYSFTTLPHGVIKEQLQNMCATTYCGFCTCDITDSKRRIIDNMAESTLSPKIEPYQFEPITVECYSENSDSDESDTNKA